MRRRETKSARVMDWEPIPDDVLVPKRARRDGPKRPFPPDVTVVRQKDGMSLADRWGLPRTRGKRRRRAVVDDVSDSSDDDATSDDDEDSETPPNVAVVLAAHLSLGWKLDSSDRLVPPRRPGSSAGHTPELLEMRRAYGIDPGNDDKDDDEPGRKDRPSDAALSALMAALSCARLCGPVLKRADYCAVALEEASKQAARFRRDIDKMRRTGVIPPWSGRPSPEDEMLASVKEKLADAQRELGEDVHRASSPFGSSRDDPDPTLAAAIAAMGGGKKVGPSQPSSLAPVAAVRVAVALDDAMYALAYHGRSCGWAGSSRFSWRPNPALYLNAVTASHAPGATVGSIAAAVRDVGDEWLDAIRRSRMEEGTYLLTAKNLPSPEDVLVSGEKAARSAGTKTKDGTPQPPPCPELVQLWRDSCRVWPCRLFAFAAPTRRALATLAKFSKRWVEIGAGLGYWAHMMERVEGIDVVALDKTPSPLTGTDAVNEYHGRAMSFCTVHKGGPESLREYENRGLFLCYPPPGDDMALDALRALRGDVPLAVVGEWDGNTGTAEFARELRKKWYLVEYARLGQWGDTAHDLTIWMRRDDPRDDVDAGNNSNGFLEAPFASCFTCGTSDATRELRRCVYCREVCFCSKRCAGDATSTALHASAHILRDVRLPAGRPDYSNDADYRPFRPCG